MRYFYLLSMVGLFNTLARWSSKSLRKCGALSNRYESELLIEEIRIRANKSRGE